DISSRTSRESSKRSARPTPTCRFVSRMPWATYLRSSTRSPRGSSLKPSDAFRLFLLADREAVVPTHRVLRVRAHAPAVLAAIARSLRGLATVDVAVADRGRIAR